MNWKLYFLVGFWSLLFFNSCRNEDISFSNIIQPLELSSDTVFLDTVYNQMRSSTYGVKIFNRENRDIIIPKIYLEKGSVSQYRINVDGKVGNSFTNTPLRAKDSLFIFIEIAPDISSKEVLVEDVIKIESENFHQKITLISLVQDAEFLISSAENPKIITENTIWDNSKVKVILGEISLAEGKTLTISKGTKVYFMQNSSLKINPNAVLNIDGDLENEVIFRGHRNEPRYDTIPKNWNAVVLEKNATTNINYAKFFGGTTGLYLNHATANIKNSIFHTFQDYGIFSINSRLNAENMVINNTGNANLGIVKGGNYNILHSTLANYWTNSHSSALAISAQNYWKNKDGKNEAENLMLTLKNSIAYTRKSNAVVFRSVDSHIFSYTIENSLIRHNKDSGFSWDNNSNIIHSIANLNPKFINYNISKMSLHLATDSPARGKGSPTVAMQVPIDIKKINRTISPNMGAYQ